MIKRNNYDLVGVSSKKIASGFGNEVYKNGTRGWKYECFEVERDNDSYDSIDDESNENSSETESFPAPRYQTFDITRLTDSTLFLVWTWLRGWERNFQIPYYSWSLNMSIAFS